MERLKFEPVPIRRAADKIEERIKENIGVYDFELSAEVFP